MSYNLKSFALVISLASIALSCSNPFPNRLPPITSEGLGTFAYKADGEVQKGCVEGLFETASSADFVADTVFTLSGSCGEHTLSILLKKKEELLENVDYKLNQTRSFINYIPPSGIDYRSNSEDGSNAMIRFHKIDKEKRIIAGTFSGKVFSSDGDLIEITEGRFD